MFRCVWVDQCSNLHWHQNGGRPICQQGLLTWKWTMWEIWNLNLTWHPRNKLEGPQNSEGPAWEDELKMFFQLPGLENISKVFCAHIFEIVGDELDLTWISFDLSMDRSGPDVFPSSVFGISIGKNLFGGKNINFGFSPILLSSYSIGTADRGYASQLMAFKWQSIWLFSNISLHDPRNIYLSWTT